MERSKILVVDDEKLVRRMIARVLESEGMSIVEASNGLDAVQMAKAQPFDLIILDIIMEGILWRGSTVFRSSTSCEARGC